MTKNIQKHEEKRKKELSMCIADFVNNKFAEKQTTMSETLSIMSKLICGIIAKISIYTEEKYNDILRLYITKVADDSTKAIKILEKVLKEEKKA